MKYPEIILGIYPKNRIFLCEAGYLSISINKVAVADIELRLRNKV